MSRCPAAGSSVCTSLGTQGHRWSRREDHRPPRPGAGRAAGSPAERPTLVNLPGPPDRPRPQAGTRPAPNVLVATTAMLAYISFWRAAAVVLNDMGSSAFYAGGIAEHFIGKTAPWFILAIMVIAYAVRAIYIESCSM